MLVGGRVVHNIRMIFRKNGVHSLRIAHGSDQHHERQIGMSLQKLLLNIIGIIFINIHDDQPAGLCVAICRQSSLPMEPPPPVTITTLFCT